jgi:rhamnosyltransferase
LTAPGSADQRDHEGKPPVRPSVCAVIVTYNPDPLHLAELVESVVPQVSTVLLVDNGSKDNVLTMLASVADLSDVHVETLGENRGIAHAHNVGIQWARRIAAEYVLLLDHDSKPAPNMIACLIGTDQALREQQVPVGAVGPVTIDRRTGMSGKFVRMSRGIMRRIGCAGESPWLEIDFLISSGTLIRLDVLERVGTMRDEFFIDHVDTDWCFRARAAGLRLFAVCDAHLYHSLGDSIQRVWIGRWRDVHVHSALRDYYMFRNTVLMLRTTPMSLQWRIALLCRLVGFFVYLGIFVPPRAKRVQLMLQGALHGLMGRGGPR